MDVYLVQRRIDFVKKTVGGGIDKEDRENEGNGGKNFFPGGWIISSTPVSRGLFGWVSTSQAFPPSNRRGKSSLNFSSIAENESMKSFWVILLILWITFCKSFKAPTKSSRCSTKKS